MPPPFQLKKSLGQHFLHDKKTAQRIAQLAQPADADILAEIGPGSGALTRFLIAQHAAHPQPLWLIEIDTDAQNYLNQQYINSTEYNPDNEKIKLFPTSILDFSLPEGLTFEFISNLPYNISSPVLFYILANRLQIPKCTFMVQKEVAERICASPGSKTYGILSVLLGWYYVLKYEFSVSKGVFTPPPKVESAVFTMVRRPIDTTEVVDFERFKAIVKSAFGNRRKTLHNALKSLPAHIHVVIPPQWQGLRAEQLPPSAFIQLAQQV